MLCRAKKPCAEAVHYFNTNETRFAGCHTMTRSECLLWEIVSFVAEKALHDLNDGKVRDPHRPHVRQWGMRALERTEADISDRCTRIFFTVRPAVMKVEPLEISFGREPFSDFAPVPVTCSSQRPWQPT